MKKCYCCGNPLPLFGRRKIRGEVICKTCFMKIPLRLRIDRKRIDGVTANRIVSRYDTDGKQYLKRFVETAKYGPLHVDGVHGLFAVCEPKKIDANGKIIGEFADVYSLLELEDYEITTKIGKPSGRTVYCGVDFFFELSSPHLRIKQTIKPKALCMTKQIDSETMAIQEPADLSFFRSVFFQAYKSAVEKYNQRIEGLYPTHHSFELLKARSLFMLEEDYTKDALKRQRNRLLKTYHPDEGADDECLMYAQKINDAYHLLAEELKENAG